ncbi:MAG: hypothetical protein SPJ34_05580 [Candidatus Ornithospirochaeta sp.]|nr:hypothetical protein [Candidatus Ornithospirochaeta sp.]
MTRILKRAAMLLAALFALVSLLPASSVDARMLSHDSEIYDLIDALYAMEGLAKANTNRPWTESQARLYLGRIGRESLPEAGRRLYDEAQRLLDSGLRWNFGNEFGLSVGMDFTNEAYAHSNSGFDTEEEWVRSWPDRKPLIRLYFEASSFDMFYTSADILYRFGRASTEDHYCMLRDMATSDGYVGSYYVRGSNAGHVVSSKYFSDPFRLNFYTNTLNFSFIWPNRAIFSLGGENWNLSFSRDRMKIGDSHIGSLLVDDHSDYDDYLKLSLYNRYFGYDFILLFLNTLTSSSEDPVNEARMYMIHTLDFRIFDKVSLKLSENVMYKYNTLSLDFLNPAFFFHNLNNRSLFNALAYIELNANIVKGLSVYGQFALDQARAPNEGTSQSSSYGVSGGIEYTAPLGIGVLESYAEYLMTSPLLYRRDGIDFIKTSRYYHMDSDNGTSGHIPFFEYIGYRYGGDTSTLKIGTRYIASPWGSLEAYIQLLEHGEMSIFSSHNKDGLNSEFANIEGSTPSGDMITRAMILSLKANGSLERLFAWPGVSAEMEIDWIHRASYEKASSSYSGYQSDIQLSIGITLAI